MFTHFVVAVVALLLQVRIGVVTEGKNTTVASLSEMKCSHGPFKEPEIRPAV